MSARLGELTALCAQLRDAERAVEAAEKELKARKADARRLVEEDIPGLMTELGDSKLKLETGEEVSVALEVYASITAANQAEAFRWLEEHGFGSLIKTGVTVRYGREQVEAALALAEELGTRGLTPEVQQEVHGQTLKAFLRERLAAEAATPPEPGQGLPLELFGARPVQTAKLKAPKRSAA